MKINHKNEKRKSIKYCKCDKFGDMNPRSITPLSCADLEAHQYRRWRFKVLKLLVFIVKSALHRYCFVVNF